jgi:NAD-dependent SIR2 family protein deacetylase
MGYHRNPRKKRTIKMVCAHCFAVDELKPQEAYAARRPRCQACGGPMNRHRETWFGAVAVSPRARTLQGSGVGNQ